jgi:hypothetical protein
MTEPLLSNKSGAEKMILVKIKRETEVDEIHLINYIFVFFEHYRDQK